MIMSLQRGGNADLLPSSPPPLLSPCDGSALQGDDAAHRHRRRSTPRRPIRPTAPHLLRVRSRRLAADLHHGARTAVPAQRISFGEGALFDAGLVAARRLHRLHQAGAAASSRIGIMKPDGSGERILPKATTTKA